MPPYLPTRPRGVPFYFSVQSITALNAICSRDGSFRPCQSPMQHAKDEDEGWLFYFDGNNTHPAPSVPSNPQIYQSYMIYYDSGRFHIAAENLDQLQLMAKMAARDGGELPDIAWRPLTFARLPYGPHPDNLTDISYAVIRGGRSELITQTYAEAQGWPFKLLPQQHHSKTLVHPTFPSGLTGDLSLLIGLLAMTIPSAAVPILLPELIAHDQWGPNWHTHDHLPAQSGWEPGRGLCVTVMFDSKQVTPNQLQSYGAGQYGVLFCRP